MEHIKKAGLSPGLIYGMGGQGGSTQGAGTANGVGLPQDQSVGMGLRAQEIGVEMGSKNVRRKQTNTERLFSNTDNR